jgi:hypothetical protein
METIKRQARVQDFRKATDASSSDADYRVAALSRSRSCRMAMGRTIWGTQRRVKATSGKLLLTIP